MENTKKKLDKKYYGIIVLVVIMIGCAIGALIGDRQDKKLDDFAAPLFEHAVPADTRLVDSVADTNSQGGHTSSIACLILQSPLSQEELEAFYSDFTPAPAREGDTATLKVYPLTDDQLESLKSSQYYQEEGGSYWYIYMYSGIDAVND